MSFLPLCRRNFLKFLGSLLLALIFSPTLVSAALAPSEVAVLAVEPDANSMRVAEHYLKARAIPAENLLLLKKAYPEDVSRDVWEKEIRPEIRRWLAVHPNVKCVVCAWSVPLRIDAPSFDLPRQKEQREFYEKQADAFREEIVRALKFAGSEVAPTDESRAATESLPDLNALDRTGWLTLLQKTVNDAKGRIQGLPEAERKAEIQKLDRIFQPCLGVEAIQMALILQVQKKAGVKPETLLKIIKIAQALEQHLVDLNFKADSQQRDEEMLKTIKILNGPFAAMTYARESRNRLDRNESRSSFDGELALIYETEAYPLVGWTPNLLAYQYGMPPKIRISMEPKSPIPAPAGLMEDPNAPASDETTEALPAPPLGQQVFMEPPELDVESDPEETEEISMKVERTRPEKAESGGGFKVPEPRRRVLMVARLEGPSVETVLRRIDEGIAAEEKGLEGAVYLDARTTRPLQATRGSYAKMEQSINDLAIRLQRFTNLNVKINTEDALFAKEACSDPCALYCGWYSVRNFQDLFTFVPGAVAYHVASFEAESLKTGPFWCPNLLEHGAAATCGPTFEPYLAAFPEPDEFYSLVLTGQFSMIECYCFTNPFNSWAMTYVGDPLYAPFRKNPKLQMNEIPENLQRFFGLRP